MGSFIIAYFILISTALYVDADCDVIPIKQWSGEESRRQEILPNPVALVVVQHTATPEGDCDDIVRAIRNYHMDKMKFDDIGQSFLICGNGKVFEGAGWGRVGAHTRSYNSQSIGLSFIGSFDSALPTYQALNASLDLLSCGVKNNHLTRDYKLVGHRQVTSTLSPGDALQKEIETWPHWNNYTK